MLPVTGPFTKTTGTLSSLVAYRRSVSYRQKPPYDIPLPYTLDWRVITVDTQSTKINVSHAGNGTTGMGSIAIQDAQVKAWRLFISRMGESADIGTALAESGEAVEMITRRASQLVKVFRSLKDGNIVRAYDELFVDFHRQRGTRRRRVGKVPKRPTDNSWWRSKTFSSLWLEWWFGWSPTISDMQSAMNVLARDTFSSRIRAHARSGLYSSTSGSKVPICGSSTSQLYRTWVGLAGYGANIRISNPNAALAADLGLVNPLRTAVELIPFSFVANWFTNLDMCLSSWNEFYGREVTNSYSTRAVEQFHHRKWFTRYRDPVTARCDFPPFFDGREAKLQTFYLQRTSGLNRPGFFVKPLARFSVTRAATAVSLLTGFLPSNPGLTLNRAFK